MEIIKESFFEVINNSIGVSPQESIIPVKRGYLASIDTFSRQRELEVYLVFNKKFLHFMCENFLGEENPSLEALEDMAKELANLVVGHAKVLTQNKNQNFTISTPQYLGVRVIKNYNHGLHFRLKGGGHCSIFMRNKD